MKDFEIGGHRDMSLEEVQDYQEEGSELAEELRDEFPPDEDIHDSLIEDEDRLEQEIMGEIEPDAELSHQEFIDEQTAFEEELMGEREPGAELSHQEFIDAQDKFEEEIMNGDSSASEMPENAEDGNSNIEQEEDFDPEWADPSFEQIVAEPDATEGDVSWAAEGFSEAAHATREEIGTAAETLDIMGDPNPIPGEISDTIQIADAVGDSAMYAMDTHIEDIDNFGTGVAEFGSNGITDTEVITAESDYLASQSTDIGDSGSGADSSDE